MILVVMGVSGCGKSTVGAEAARQLGWVFQDADDYHSSENIAKMRQGIPLQDRDREGWLQTLADLIRNYEERQASMILACSALKQTYRDRLLISSAVKVVYLKGSQQVITQRLAGRPSHFMNPALLESQFQILEEPDEAQVVNVEWSLAAQVEAIVTFVSRVRT